MFGLMKNTGCMQPGQPDWYRLHYCGTCKSLGRIYGQRSRFFLNFDIVFLAEILSLLQKEDSQNWDKSLFSKNCFDLPKTENIPTSIQFSADINMLLVEMKVRDNIVDDFSELWKFAQRLLKKPFSKVEPRMKLWDINPQAILDWQEEDMNRENQLVKNNSIPNLLKYHSEPSAKITGYLFSKGADAIQKEEWKDVVYKIGFSFGELTYALDAWKDMEKDDANEEFNPLLQNDVEEPIVRKQQAADWVWEKAKEIQQLIESVEIKESVKKSLQGRLQMNLAAALGEASHVCVSNPEIRKSTVPTVLRTTFKFISELRSWFNPLRPTKFVVTYLMILLVFFQNQLMAAVDILKEPSLWDPNQILFLSALAMIPVGLYLGGKKLHKNRKRIKRRLRRKQRRLMRRIRRAKRRAEEGKKRKWWHWVLIVLGLIVVAIVLLVLLVLVGSGDIDCGGACDGIDCGGGCGDCSGGGGGSGCDCS